jgi:transcriptional regulator with XRE-family HTH domain
VSGVVYVPTIRRRRLGVALRRLREGTGRSADNVAEALGWSQSKVSRIETAAITVSPADVRALLELYDADPGEAAELVGLAVEDRQPAWWRQYGDVLPEGYKTYLSLESQAVRVVSYQSEVLPGLLQTEAYAHEIIRQHPLMIVPYEVEQATRLRLARQARLRGTDPLHLDVVVNEGALRCGVGGRDVMREQLAHLYEVMALPHVTVWVLPFEAGAHPATNGSFHVVEFPHADDPRILCLEALTVTFYREDRREVETYLLVHERLRALALDPEASRAYVGSLVENHPG